MSEMTASERRNAAWKARNDASMAHTIISDAVTYIRDPSIKAQAESLVDALAAETEKAREEYEAANRELFGE